MTHANFLASGLAEIYNRIPSAVDCDLNVAHVSLISH